MIVCKEMDFCSLYLLHYCRNRLLLSTLNICKDVLGRLPKVVGIDVVEMALWAKVHNGLLILKLEVDLQSSYSHCLLYLFNLCTQHLLLWTEGDLSH